MDQVESEKHGFIVDFIVSVILFRKARKAGTAVTNQLWEKKRKQQKPLAIQLILTCAAILGLPAASLPPGFVCGKSKHLQMDSHSRSSGTL